MKRTLLSLLVVAASLAVMGQVEEEYEMVYIHRNDMDFNIFFRDEIISISYSNYDADSVFHEQPVSQVVTTDDSTYVIPLEVIDSVSFVRPPTVYSASVTELTADFLDYIVSVDNLTLTLRRDIPSALMPKVGDKLAYLHFSEVLPNGFLGTVQTISDGADGYVLSCEALSIDDAVERYYGMFLTGIMGNPYELLEAKPQYPKVKEHSPVGAMYARAKAKYAGAKQRSPIEVTTLSPESKLVTVKNLPISADLLDIDLLRDAFEEKPYAEGGVNLGGKAEFNGTIAPLQMIIRYSIAKDSFKDLLTIAKISVDARMFAKGDFDLVGKLQHEVKLLSPWAPETEIFPGVSVYLKPGIEFSGTGEFGIGWDYLGSGRFKADFTIYPPIIPTPLMPFNVLPGRPRAQGESQFDWKHLVGRVNLHAGLFAEVGFGLVTQKIANLHIQCGLGLDVDAEVKIDEDAWRTAEEDTRFYDISKDNMKVEFSPVVSIGGGVGFLDNRLKSDIVVPFRLPWPHYEGNLLPTFEDVDVQQSKDVYTSADVHAYTEPGLLDFRIGTTMRDESGKRLNTLFEPDDDLWHESHQVFEGLLPGQTYTFNPTFELFGKNVLASPETEYTVPEPVTISGFRMTHSSYYEKGFEYEGSTYTYRYNTEMRVSLISDEGVEDWGFVYEDPHGKQAYISLMGQESPVYETDYAYFRNSATAAARLYGYVKYADSGEIKLCTPRDYPLLYEEWPLCPDDNHPHAIDLGLPSGIKWACCNIGTRVPCGSGGYYCWGEISTKSSYEFDNYVYRIPTTSFDCVFLGWDIAGTQYDAATANWRAPWKMPSREQFVELFHNTSMSWVTHNGVDGIQLTAKNGQAIFLPAVANLGYSHPWLVHDCTYWSSNHASPTARDENGRPLNWDQYENAAYYTNDCAEGIWIRPGNNFYNGFSGPRSSGLPIRAVRE